MTTTNNIKINKKQFKIHMALCYSKCHFEIQITKDIYVEMK